MMAGSPEEKDLLARCARGEEAAWTTVYRLHGRRVARFLRCLLGPSAEIDDLVQQVFVEMALSAGNFRSDSGLDTWMYGIARNVALRKARAAGMERQALRGWADASGAADPWDSDPAVIHERDGLRQWVTRGVGAMKPEHREVWLMVDVEEMRPDRVAGVIDIPAATVRSRLARAREILVRFIELGGWGRKRPCSVTRLVPRRESTPGEED